MITSPLALAFVVVGLVVLAATGNLFSWSPLVIAVQIAAVALNVWARTSFETGTFRVSAAPGGRSIMRRGPYRVIRHPMYAAVLLFAWAGVTSHASAFTLVIGVALTAVIVARVIAEERLLRAAYPDYDAYARTTKALVPYLF
jgi:protein-S-isoprenylcysteine O-methyltransferase Ste14